MQLGGVVTTKLTGCIFICFFRMAGKPAPQTMKINTFRLCLNNYRIGWPDQFSDLTPPFVKEEKKLKRQNNYLF